jgi:hypothetical protein
MRYIIASLVVLAILGCDSSRPASPGQAAAIQAARQWLESRGIDLKNYKFDARPDDAGWTVMAEYQPPTPGAHTLLRIDFQDNVVEVFPGW